jgi:hypothetical protein
MKEGWLAQIRSGAEKDFSYAEAERLLAELYGASRIVREKGFRARLKHLKRLGIPLDSRPGRGSKIRYSRDELYQWAFCLELAESGMDPKEAAELVVRSWRSEISGLFSSINSQSDDSTLLAIHANLMSRSWSNQKPKISVVNSKWAEDFVQHLTESNRRVILINLSDLVRELKRKTGG